MIYIGQKYDFLDAKRNFETNKHNALCAMYFYEKSRLMKHLNKAIKCTCEALRYKRLMNQILKG